MMSILPKRIDNSMFVLNFGSRLLSTSIFSLDYLRLYFSHSDAYVAGSMTKGVLTLLVIITAFSIERSSAGRPSFFQVSNYCSVLKKFVNLKSYNLRADSQLLRVYSLTTSLQLPIYVM